MDILFTVTLSLILCQNPAPSLENPVVVRWKDVAQYAKTHPALLAAQEQINAAQGRLRTARQFSNPELEAGIGPSQALEGKEKRPVWEASLNFPLEWPGKRRTRAAAAKEWVLVASDEAVETQARLFRNLRELFLNTGYNQEHLGALRNAEADLEHLVQAIEVRVTAGEARPVELVRATGELEEHRAALDEAEAEAVGTRRQLAQWLGGTLPLIFTIEAGLETLPELPDVNTVIFGALEVYPALLTAKTRVALGKATLLAEQKAAAPDFSLGVFAGREIDSEQWGLTAGISLPLWNRNQGGIATAESEKKKAEWELANLEWELRQEAATLHARISGLLAAIERYTSSVLPSTREAVSVQEQLYEAGEIGLLEVLDSRRAQTRATITYYQQLLACHLAYLELQGLMGEFNHE